MESENIDTAAILPSDIQGPCFDTHTASMFIQSVGMLQKEIYPSSLKKMSPQETVMYV